MYFKAVSRTTKKHENHEVNEPFSVFRQRNTCHRKGSISVKLDSLEVAVFIYCNK